MLVYFGQHLWQAVQHLLVGKTNNRKAALLQCLRAAAVICHCFGRLVDGPIYFYYEPSRQANEVYKVVCYGMLSAKPVA